MIFSEIYSSYFHTVAAILSEAVSRTLTGAKLNEIVQEKAFSESILTIPSSLRENWFLLEDDFTTPLHHKPSMPLATLEKRWLKTLLQDKRIALFTPDLTGLEEVEPLFRIDDVVWFDQYLDGDPYEEESYVTIFRQLLTAIQTHRKVRLAYKGHAAREHNHVCIPYCLEYSEKDDKFRLLAVRGRTNYIINVARIRTCEILGEVDPKNFPIPQKKQSAVTFRLRDERQALDRVLLHFSHLAKETVKVGEREYEVTLHYDTADETELLIRILSFGPLVQVIAPEEFIDQVKERLQWQSRLDKARKNI